MRAHLVQIMTDLTDTTEVPIPDEPGSSGEQESATGEVLPVEPQTGLPVVDAIVKGIAASPRALGEFGSAMLAGAARQLEKENQELRQEVQNLRTSSVTRRDELEHERIRNAKLTERVASEKGHRHIRNFGITVGTALASTGLFPNSIIDNQYSWALFAAGTLLLLVSWFSPFSRRDSDPKKGNEN